MNQTVRGGGHVGPNPWVGYRATWPFASLSVSRDTIVLSVWPLRYRFDRASMRCLLKKRILGRPSLFIIHANPAYPKSVVFQPVRFSVVESVLGAHGYQISTQEPRATIDVGYSNKVAVYAVVAAMLGLIAAIVSIVVAVK